RSRPSDRFGPTCRQAWLPSSSTDGGMSHDHRSCRDAAPGSFCRRGDSAGNRAGSSGGAVFMTGALDQERLLTPSKVTAWLDCPHYLALCAQVDDGALPRPQQRFGSFAELLLNKGLSHEQACLTEYRRQGRRILEVPA